MIEEAVNHFKRGNVVIFPTDTFYGIGCDVRREESIRRVYKIRKDTLAKPLLILASDQTQAFEYGIFKSSEKKLVEKLWPCPLTVVVKARDKTPMMIQGKSGTIGVRVPNQPLLIEIIKKLGAPIIAPSANFHGSKPPARFNEIDKDILALVDYAIDPRLLPKKIEMKKKPSTIVDLTAIPIKILRSGAISTEKIAKTMKGVGK
jgi:L-threonylcarbamoyladenylate synthase